MASAHATTAAPASSGRLAYGQALASNVLARLNPARATTGVGATGATAAPAESSGRGWYAAAGAVLFLGGFAAFYAVDRVRASLAAAGPNRYEPAELLRGNCAHAAEPGSAPASADHFFISRGAARRSIPEPRADGMPEEPRRIADALVVQLKPLTGDMLTMDHIADAERRLLALSDAIGQRYFLQLRKTESAEILA